jgi:hypothetical protein
MKRLLLASLAFALAARAAPAQNPRATHIPASVLYGKWGLLGAAVGFNLAALHQHHVADDIFAQLSDRCSANDHVLCTTDASGHYTNPESEAIYQASLTADGRARTWLVVGETALLGSAALFVWELSRPKGPPRNIPFTPRIAVEHGRPTVGMSLRF